MPRYDFDMITIGAGSGGVASSRRAGSYGARVEIETEGDRIIITPAKPHYILAELLKGMTPEAMREAFDWGPNTGREIVE